MTPEPSSCNREQSSKERITKAAGIISFATLISRILGFIRDMIIADLLGAKIVADAFFVAFRIPNLLRRLTAEGAMTAAFVPVFTESLIKENKKAAFSLACNVITILAISLMLFTVLCEIFAPWIVRVVAPGFIFDPRSLELTTLLTRIMFPYLVLISISAVLMAMLNSMGRFFVPAASPALLNISIITCAFIFKDKLDEPAMALAIGVLIGGFLQMSIQLWPLARLGFRYASSFNLNDVKTRKIGILMIPAAFGMAVAEINIFVDTMLASLLPEGSISYLYYGNRVTQFPLGVFGVAVGVAALPSMSSEVAKGSTGKVTELLSHSLRLILFISIPATFGLVALAEPITNALFERGQFDEAARAGCAVAIIYYAVGLVAFSGVKIVVSAFYSMQDTKTPTLVAVWCMLLNIALNLALMGPLKHGGLALATSISSAVNVTALMWILKRRLGSVDGARIISSVAPMLGASIIMAVAVYFYSQEFYHYDASMALRATHLVVAISMGTILYFGVALILGSREARSVRDRIFKALKVGG